ncbi:glucosaminidase domain-containing protein [Candidatus Enterococcus murrayae]|uniref:Glucosaminidase domain-containing protein n=1 Tax=Candidatus Enterococcus murrayae TaxID=2815321 RepID=A0ABS3HBV1_9ENTE|nr:glucosaminidase domain-containing protein [Enterococcus sp. MJM16]MBO0450937.1 glucosaminidase domain-containing protein [Enterococcus sp. MJM16]
MKKKLLSICILGISAYTIHNLFGEKLKADELSIVEESSNVIEYSPTVESSSKSIQSVNAQESSEKGTIEEVVPSAEQKEEDLQSTAPPTKTNETSDNLKTSSNEINSSSELSSTSTSSTLTTETTSTSTAESGSSETTSSSTTMTSEMSSSQSSRPEESSTATSNSIQDSKESSEVVEGTTNSEKKEQKSESIVGSSNQTVVQSPDPSPFSVNIQSMLPTYSHPSESSVLSSKEAKVELDEALQVSKVAESDLKGFELPLLGTFENKNKAILVFEGIKLVGKEKETDSQVNSVEKLLNQLTSKLFGEDFEHVKKANSKTREPGDLLYKKNTLVGMYLGDDHYLSYEQKEKDEDDSYGEVVIEQFTSEEPETLFQYSEMIDLTATDYGKEVEKNYPASMDFQPNDQTAAFIEEISDNAQDLGLKYDVFASVMIAQAILESGSGTSQLSIAPYHNLFGIKGTFKGSFVNFSTQEDDGSGEMHSINAAFRSYSSYGESLGDYVTLIRSGIQGNENYYSTAWRSNAKNYLRAADALTGRYATDTSYNRKISSLIAAYHLTQYDVPKSVEGTQTGAVLQGKENIPEEYRSAMKFPDYDGKNYNSSGSYPVGQCTWYAYNRVAQLGKKVDDFMGNGGEWGSKGRALGHKVTQTPTAGYLISFSPGTAGSDPRYGHVAFVEAVTSNGILISESNVIGGTIISYRVIDNELAKSTLVSYIEPK